MARTTIKNKTRLLRKIAAMPRVARSEIETALRDSAEEITAAMRQFVPVDTGALRDSIGWRFTFSSATGITARIVAGDGHAYYARFVEFGTAPHSVAKGANLDSRKRGGSRQSQGPQHPGSAPQPFFFPIYRTLRRRVRSRIARAVGRAGRRAAKMS